MRSTAVVLPCVTRPTTGGSPSWPALPGPPPPGTGQDRAAGRSLNNSAARRPTPKTRAPSHSPRQLLPPFFFSPWRRPARPPRSPGTRRPPTLRWRRACPNLQTRSERERRGEGKEKRRGTSDNKPTPLSFSIHPILPFSHARTPPSALSLSAGALCLRRLCLPPPDRPGPDGPGGGRVRGRGRAPAPGRRWVGARQSARPAGGGERAEHGGGAGRCACWDDGERWRSHSRSEKRERRAGAHATHSRPRSPPSFSLRPPTHSPSLFLSPLNKSNPRERAATAALQKREPSQRTRPLGPPGPLRRRPGRWSSTPAPRLRL